MATRMFNACEHFVNIITFTVSGKRCILMSCDRPSYQAAQLKGKVCRGARTREPHDALPNMDLK